MLRTRSLLLMLISATPFQPAAQEEPTPQTAYVAADRCAVRSGPGDDHYVTEYLGRGEAVEIYQKIGDWLAIRPPKASFSWVAQRDVELSSVSGVAVVVGSSAVSWIGSNTENVSNHRWLVKLSEGEPVSILGQERHKMLSDGKSDIYFKIAPPAGEFRWLHEDDVVGSKDELARRDISIQVADFRVAIGENGRTAAASRAGSRSTAEAKKDDFMGRGSEFARAPQLATPRASMSDSSERSQSPARVARSEIRSGASESLSTDDPSTENALRGLEVRLSLMVAQPVEQWSFAALRANAESLAARATSTLERARLQVFLDKVADFESLRSRHALFTSSTGIGATRERLDAARAENSVARPGGAYDPRFDGTGWLLPVHSTKRASPPYALLDSEGNILQFVSPAPGLNLHRYLRKEIGVFGQKVAVNVLDKPHLTAHRVVELDRHRK